MKEAKWMRELLSPLGTKLRNAPRIERSEIGSTFTNVGSQGHIAVLDVSAAPIWDAHPRRKT